MTPSITSFTYHRQRLGKQGATASEVLKDIIGVYSWHPSGPLSLLARVKGFKPADFYELDNDKLAYRVPAMRLSNYMLPSESTFKIMSAVVPLLGDMIWEKRYSNPARIVPEGDYFDWRETILKLTQKPLEASEIKKFTDIPDISLKPLLNRMAFEGYLLRVGSQSLRSNIIKYISTKSFTGQNYKPIDPDKSLAWLAGEYLRAFGPVRIKDFQWWTAVTAPRAKAAMSSQDTIEVEKGLLLLKQDINEFESVKPIAKDSIDIIPQWDSYTMGYAPDGRQRFISPDMQVHAYGSIGATGGNGLGLVLLNGYVIAVWEPKFTGDNLKIKLNLFEKPKSSINEKMTSGFNEIGAFLRAKKVAIG